jgi:hypothetical protein
VDGNESAIRYRVDRGRPRRAVQYTQLSKKFAFTSQTQELLTLIHLFGKGNRTFLDDIEDVLQAALATNNGARFALTGINSVD